MKLDVRQAARLLAVPETQIYRWVDDGAIPCYMVRHQALFSRVELLDWATARRLPISVELFAGSSARLADALARGGVHAHVAGTDRDAVLAAVVERLPLPASADRAQILEIMRARETQASTGIGLGIAIPHVRAPLVFAGGAAAITVCYLDHDVAFDAVDQRPVHTIFAMMSPTVRVHLELLSRLSHALLDPGFLAAVERRGALDELLVEARRVEALLPDTDDDDDEPEIDDDGTGGSDDDGAARP